jgi:ribosomal protein S18 acetylase RimI-like enzyme
MLDVRVPPVAPSIRHAGASDHEAVVRVLVRAFDDDPAINYLLRQDAHRARAFELAFGAFFRHMTMPFGETWMDADGRGAALWTPPGKWDVRLGTAALMSPAILRAVSLPRIPKVLRAGASVHEKHPKAPHYYLFAIGVDPASQGKGVGSALLRHVLSRCDSEGAAAYLEASKPENARLYARHGFHVTEEFKMASDAPPVWLMWRDPQPS